MQMGVSSVEGYKQFNTVKHCFLSEAYEVLTSCCSFTILALKIEDENVALNHPITVCLLQLVMMSE